MTTLRRGSTETHYALEGRFAGLGDAMKGLLISAVADPTADLAVFGMRYRTRTLGTPRARASSWVTVPSPRLSLNGGAIDRPKNVAGRSAEPLSGPWDK
jgi:hypothetical protein